MITVAVEVWSWKLYQIKDPLVFGAAIHGSVNLYIAQQNKTNRRAGERDDSTTYTVGCFDSRNGKCKAKCQWIFDLA